MEKYPVVVKCEDVYVAVPIYTLIRELPIFKSMFDVQIKRLVFTFYYEKLIFMNYSISSSFSIAILHCFSLTPCLSLIQPMHNQIDWPVD